jgi:hypothetical protein
MWSCLLENLDGTGSFARQLHISEVLPFSGCTGARKDGKGQVAENTGAAVDFDPVVIFIMSLFASPTVPDNRIAQTLRTTAGNLFLAGSSPVEGWVARIHAKWDKENRTAWEALSRNEVL